MPSAIASIPPQLGRNRDSLQKWTLWFLAVFVFCVPWENAVIIPGIGTIGRIMGGCAFVLGLLSIAFRKKVRALHFSHILTLLFILWSTVTYSWTLSADLSLVRIITYVQLFIMVWQIWEFASNREEQVVLMKAYVAGSYISVASTVINYLSGKTAAYERYAAGGFDPNDLGLILVLSLPMSIHLIGLIDKGAWAWILRLHVICALGGVLLTASRGALLASGVALLIYPTVFFRMPLKQKMVIVGMAVVGAIGVAMIIPQTSLERLATIGSEVKRGTLNERRVIWDAGFRVVSEVPFTGIGTGAFPVAVEPVLGAQRAAHNLFMSVLTETGIPGLTIFISIILSLVVSAIRTPAHERRFLLTMLCAWGIGVSSLTWEFRKPTWFVFGLIAAYASSRRSAPSKMWVVSRTHTTPAIQGQLYAD